MAKQPVFTKVEQLRPLADGLHLTVKVVSSKSIVPKGHADGTQGRQMRLAECLVGDETGIIIFTARNEQGDRAEHGLELEISTHTPFQMGLNYEAGEAEQKVGFTCTLELEGESNLLEMKNY